jgi:hypothetical protein
LIGGWCDDHDQRRACNDLQRGPGCRPRLPPRYARNPLHDSGGGWLIFKLPPAELGVHGGDNGFHQIYFMCDDAQAFARQMAGRSVETLPITEDWGRSTGVTLPGGGTVGVYEPRHARP